MSIVAGVDFGTLSVRVTLLDSARGQGDRVKGHLGTASAEYPLKRKREDPDYATQSHQDQMEALVKATRHWRLAWSSVSIVQARVTLAGG